MTVDGRMPYPGLLMKIGYSRCTHSKQTPVLGQSSSGACKLLDADTIR
jgi:hypothetical protein